MYPGIEEGRLGPGLTLKQSGQAAAKAVHVLRGYRRANLRPDLVAGVTVAVVALPQCIAYAAIAGLPPSYGLYTAIVATIVGAFWGSSRYLSTGPTNAISILVLSILTPLAAVGAPEYLVAASVMALMVGVFCITFGLLGLGMLVNFASRAVLLGFTAGAGVLIAAGQLKNLLRLEAPRSHNLWQSLAGVLEHVGETHFVSLGLGIVTVLATLVVNRFNKRLPGALIALVGTGVVVAVLGVERLGVSVIGEVPRALPQFTTFSLAWAMDSDLIGALVMGALAVAALGVVEAISIGREIARQSGERLDVNQELVGQGLANIAAGIFSGYPCSGSFTRSAVNYQSGARTQLSSVFCGLFVLIGVLAFGPLATYLPRSSLAGFIMLIAYRMIDWEGVRRILGTSRTETMIMVCTFLATLVFPLEFAVLAGVILSLAIYIYQSSMPWVHSVVPDENFRHMVDRPDAPACPQLGVINISGDLFFGAANHVEDALLVNYEKNPGQSHLLLRMHGVNRCDLSGLDVLEGVMRLYRDAGGDVYLVQVREPVRELMEQAGFDKELGEANFLAQEEAIEWIFDEVLDPAVCCYECEHKVFAECQPLEKHSYGIALPSFTGPIVYPGQHLNVPEFVDALAGSGDGLQLIDVREPEEYARGHIAGARLLPLRLIIEDPDQVPRDRPVYLVCRSGRRSTRAMRWLMGLGYKEVFNLKGGILSWKALGQPYEVD